MMIAFERQIFNKVIIIEQLYHLICTLNINLVVFKIQIEQVVVVAEWLRKIKYLRTFNLIFSDVQVLEGMIADKELCKM